jgi:cytochrome c oxidase assembly protein subunit 19
MSAPSSRNRLFIPKAPEKGSFPLDHEGECKDIINKYLKCLKGTELDSSQCREVAKEYLGCRMDRNLMAKDDFKNLGFHESSPESK